MVSLENANVTFTVFDDVQLIFSFLIMNPDTTGSDYIFTLKCIGGTLYFHFSCLLQ